MIKMSSSAPHGDSVQISLVRLQILLACVVTDPSVGGREGETKVLQYVTAGLDNPEEVPLIVAVAVVCVLLLCFFGS